MKYFIRGKGEVNLSQNDFVAKGGEGSIFKKGNISYKIYEDSKKMIPEAKIKELQTIKNQNVIKPKDIILNNKNTIIGFTMKWIDGIPLCKLFTNDFRKRNGVLEDTIIELVENMKLTINSIHKSKCIIVDGNEFNYLFDQKKFNLPYFIDVNSYQTPSFPATAIMPSIKDWHSKTFSELSDWFSFAIIACQLFIGLHPFKGRHPNYKKNDFESRMKDNVSIFNSKVRMPPPTRNFNLIPSKYKEWFINLFEKGIRLEPPDLPGSIIVSQVQITLIQSTNNFKISFLKEFKSEIFHHMIIYGNRVTKIKNKIFIGNRDFKISHETEVLFTPKYITPILVKKDQNKIKFKCLDNNKTLISLNLNCQEILITNNILYIRNEGDLIETSFIESSNKINLIVKNIWKIMPYSSIVFSNVIYQNVLGKSYLVIPIPKIDGLSSCIIKEIPEIEKFKIIEAKHDSNVCILIGFKSGIYYRIILKFDEKYEKYSYRIIEDITTPVINFITLTNGIVLLMNNDKLEVFSKDISKPTIKVFDDPNINSTMKLCKDGTKVMFFKENKLYEIKMR